MFDSPAWLVGVALFFAGHYALRRCETSNAAMNLYLALASLAMYAAWNPRAAVGLFLVAVLLYMHGQLLEKAAAAPLLVAGMLLALAVSKYWGGTPALLGVPADQHRSFFVIGISFYLFTAIGYMVDVTWRQAPPLTRVREFVVLVAFWPHLAAGPILRLEHMRAGLRDKLKVTDPVMRLAIVLILCGLAKKYWLADGVGAYVDANLSPATGGIAGMNAVSAAVTLLGFGTQIYFDFSGYSDIAIGCAYLLGFRLPANFNYPYLSASVTEFWRRWHISLSTWFRDYVFVPLGGSRRGNVYANLLIVFALSGIWHGTGMSFLVWGLVHGGCVCAEKLAGSRIERVPMLLRRLYVIVAVMAAWAFFRVDSSQAAAWLRKMGQWGGAFTFDSAYHLLPILFFVAMLVVDHLVRPYRVGADGFI